VILSHRIALVPTAAQEILLRQAVGVSRFSYSWALTEWQRQYQAGQKPNEGALRRQLNSINRQPYPWMLSRWHSRKKKGSSNRRKWALRLAHLHAPVDRDTNASTNLRCYAIDRASCAQINACGEEGSGAGPLGWRETGLVETGISHVLFGHGFEQRSQ
jgi:hypothetical protein